MSTSCRIAGDARCDTPLGWRKLPGSAGWQPVCLLAGASACCESVCEICHRVTGLDQWPGIDFHRASYWPWLGGDYGVDDLAAEQFGSISLFFGRWRRIIGGFDGQFSEVTERRIHSRDAELHPLGVFLQRLGLEWLLAVRLKEVDGAGPRQGDTPAWCGSNACRPSALAPGV